MSDFTTPFNTLAAAEAAQDGLSPSAANDALDTIEAVKAELSSVYAQLAEVGQQRDTARALADERANKIRTISRTLNECLQGLVEAGDLDLRTAAEIMANVPVPVAEVEVAVEVEWTATVNVYGTVESTVSVPWTDAEDLEVDDHDLDIDWGDVVRDAIVYEGQYDLDDTNIEGTRLA